MIKIWIIIVSFLLSLANPATKAEIKPEQPDIEKAFVLFNGYIMADEDIEYPLHRVSMLEYITSEKGYRHFRRVWIGDEDEVEEAETEILGPIPLAPPNAVIILDKDQRKRITRYRGVLALDAYEGYDPNEYRFKIMADKYKLIVIHHDL